MIVVSIFLGLIGVIGIIVCLIGVLVSMLSKGRKKGWLKSLVIFFVFTFLGIGMFLFSAPQEFASQRDFSPAPIIIYTTAAEENGLGDENMYVEGVAGKVKKVKEAKNMEVCEITTSEGKIAMISVPILTSSKEWKKLKEGSVVKVYFQYLGYSDVLDEASGGLIKVDQIN